MYNVMTAEKISKSGESSAESFPSFRTPQETLSNTTDNESVTGS